MLANGIKETTGTSGTGTVTLASITGFTRFANGFANGALASYAIRDGNNWEWGVGTVGAGNTLARTTIIATLVAGTYTTTGATAITLASGSAEVIGVDHTGTTRPISNLTGTSANLAAALTDETGTGSAVFGTNPTLTGATLAGTVAGGGNQLNNVIIGASTPLAGSFTTLSASGQSYLRDRVQITGIGGAALTGMGVEIGFNTTTGVGQILSYDRTGSAYKPISYDALTHSLQTSGVEKVLISSTGLAVTGALSATGGINNTVIGASTPLAGSFTTLNTSGAIVNTSGTAAALDFSGSTTNAQYARIRSTGADLILGVANSVGAGLTTPAIDAYGAILTTGNPTPLWLGSNSVGIAKISSTGLAVTGALSATGTRLGIFVSGTNPASSGATTGVSIGYDNNAEYGWVQATRNSTAELRTLQLNPLGGSTTIGAGLAVTGAISATGTVTASGILTAGGLNATVGGFYNSANKFGVDNNVGTSRFYSSGPNSTTRGTYDFRLTDSVGTLDTSGMTLSSTGLAVTGALSATGAISTTIASKTASFDSLGGSIFSAYNDATRTWRSGVGIISAGRYSIFDVTGAAEIVGVSSTGLAVTGALSATGAVSGSNLSGTNTGDQTNISGNAATANYFVLNGSSDLSAVTSAGVYRQEIPDSGYSYTTTLNLNSSDGRQQITVERSGGGMKFRGTPTGSGTASWSGWKTVLDSSNYNSYSPTLTGGNASGTWGINISGNAATVNNFSGTSSGTNTGDNTTATALQSATTTVNVAAATAPIAGQVLTATSSTAATWQAAGATLTDDTTTNTNAQYLGMSRVTSGAWTSAFVASTKLYFNPSTGTLSSTAFNSLSDASKKTNVQPIIDAVSTIGKLQGVEFNWIEDGNKSSGVIAQQLALVLPHLVSTNMDDGVKSVNYAGIIGYLIEANKELAVANNVLSTRVTLLENNA